MNIMRHQAFARRQSGATLIIALMFLVVVTILGVGMFFTGSSDEIVARNFRDREIALRSAESAINEAKLRIHGMFDKTSLPSDAPDGLSVSSCDLPTLPSGFSCDKTTYASSTVNLFGGAPPPGTDVGSYNPNAPDANIVSPALGLSAQPRYLVVLADIQECSVSAVAGADGVDTRECFKIFGQGRGRLASTRVNLIEMYLR